MEQIKENKWKGWKDLLGYKSTSDVAEAMSVTPEKARAFIKKHKVPHSKTSGGHIRLHNEEWEEFLTIWDSVRLNLK